MERYEKVFKEKEKVEETTIFPASKEIALILHKYYPEHNYPAALEISNCILNALDIYISTFSIEDLSRWRANLIKSLSNKLHTF